MCSGDTWTDAQPCSLGCNTPLNRCRVFTPLNLTAAHLTNFPGGDVLVDTATTYNTTTCAALAGATSEVLNGLCVLRAGGITINADVTVTGTRPLVLVGVDGVRLTARLDVRASGTTPGPGGFAGGTTDNAAGQGPGGGGGGAHVGTYSDGGGGGGGHGTVGGAGGQGGSAQGGGGGARVTGLTGLQPLHGGSGGGAAGYRGRGGAGGGAVQLVSMGSITIGTGGVITTGGSGGRPANGLNGGNWGSGGGGGAGGTILLEAPTIVVTGVLASHGGGGAGADGASNLVTCGTGTWATGGAGGAGAANGVAASGGASGGGCGAKGGDGSSTAVPDGQPGANNTEANANGGGGGGGAGRIVLRSGASVPPTVGNGVTPAAELGTLDLEP